MEHEFYYDEGVKLYDQGFYLKNTEDIQAIVNALDYFIKTNKLLNDADILKPKTLCYIALCNYKIGNIDIAYHIAMKAKNYIIKVINNDPFSGISIEMIGELQIDDLINTIKEKFQDSIVDFENENINENLVDLNKISKYLSVNAEYLSKSELEYHIKLFGDIQNQISVIGDKRNNATRAAELIHLFEVYKTPLLFAWEKYNYGSHSDFWQEGDTMFNYMNFTFQPNQALSAIIKAWEAEPPVGFLGEKANLISDKVIAIYKRILNEM